MESKIIVHISEVDITPNSGMGRVEYYWKNAFENRGYEFIHIGPCEVGYIMHKGLFAYKAYWYFKKLKIKPSAFIVHEPFSGVFANHGIPCFVESHGVERRAWENNIIIEKLRTRIFFPIWRLRNCDKGIKNATKLLLINSDDKTYVENKYKRKSDDIFIFKNGVKIFKDFVYEDSLREFTILFNGSWIERKGIDVLVSAANELFCKGLVINYLLIGTGKKSSEVLNDWPQDLRKFVTVIDKFESCKEIEYLSMANVFVLPSFSEGQPLSLLQAMSAGKCCITTNTCGQKDIVKNGETGFLIPVGDYKILSNTIYKCYQNSELVKYIGENAKLEMKLRTWKIVSDEVVDYVLKFS
jgi:glycosyltransferase involved in cell wall biosynthesis